MQHIYCHNCSSHSSVDSRWNGHCPRCNDVFVEVILSGSHPGARTERSESRQQELPLPSLEQVFNAHISGISGGNQIEQLVTQVVPLFGLGNQQEFFDQLATRMMDEYQPSARPTAQRVRISLETLRVRNADPASEPKGGEAFACAGEPCSVCHDEFSAGVGVIELPCSHCFHKDCIFPWLESHNTCPVCRIELPEET